MRAGDLRASAKNNTIVVDIAAESGLSHASHIQKHKCYLGIFMKEFIAGLALVAVMVPSVASAATPAASLSVKSASVQPVRAAAKSGKAKAVPKPSFLLVLFAAAGGIAILLAGGSDSK